MGWAVTAIPFAFNVYGTPRPLPRGRHTGGRVVSIASRLAKLWRSAVERAVRSAIADSQRAAPLFRGAVRVTCVFVFKPPARQAHRIGQPHTFKPDASNLLKLVEDVMEAAGVFGNDCQISEPRPSKVWGNRPGVSVIVEDVSDARLAPATATAAEPPEWLRSRSTG